jgi:diguanylate cyclase
MSRLLDLLLTTEEAQRARLSQVGLAMAVLAAGVAAMHYFVWVGVARAVPVAWWAAVTFAGMLGFFLLIRSGWSRRFGEPSMTVPQMVFAIGSAAVAYSLLGAARGAVFPMLMVILMFGMFIATPRQMRWMSVYAVLGFGLTMGWMTATRPSEYPLRIEVGHFLLVATMSPAVSLLAGRLSRMRQLARKQRDALAAALAQLREHATRDENTGLVNRRHMQELLEQEHQRCTRSGQIFCIAMLDIDGFKPVNEVHGYPVGDTVLRAVAQEALRHVRGSDVLSRWDSDAFVLLLGDTRAALARGGIERLQQRVGALRILHQGTVLSVTLSAGLAEHHAGETVAHALERAERALREAQGHGRAHVAIAT